MKNSDKKDSKEDAMRMLILQKNHGEEVKLEEKCYIEGREIFKRKIIFLLFEFK